MRRVIFILILSTGLIASATAQGLPIHNQYSINPLIMNPSYAGSLDALNLVASYRQQWTGIDGAPRTLTFSSHSPISQSRSAVGLSIISDQIGALDQTSVFASYSYKIPFEFGTLSAGLSVGGYQLRSNLSNANLSGSQDPAFLSGDVNEWSFNSGFGLFLRSDKYYVGFSVPQILSNNYSNESDLFTINTKVQYYITGGYVFDIGSGPFALKPFALLRFEPDTPYHFDVALQAYYDELISLGVQYRMNDATALLFGLALNNSIYIDYAFEIPVGSEVNISTTGSTHEVVLNYLLPWPKNGQELKMRYF